MRPWYQKPIPGRSSKQIHHVPRGKPPDVRLGPFVCISQVMPSEHWNQASQCRCRYWTGWLSECFPSYSPPLGQLPWDSYRGTAHEDLNCPSVVVGRLGCRWQLGSLAAGRDAARHAECKNVGKHECDGGISLTRILNGCDGYPCAASACNLASGAEFPQWQPEQNHGSCPGGDVVLEGEREAALCSCEWVVDPQLRRGRRVHLPHDGRRLDRWDGGPPLTWILTACTITIILVVGSSHISGWCLDLPFGCNDGACGICSQVGRGSCEYNLRVRISRARGTDHEGGSAAALCRRRCKCAIKSEVGQLESDLITLV